MSHTSYFADSYGFVIEGGNFASVHGNQVINNNQQIYHIPQEKQRTEYDDFHQVISGSIYRTKDFGVYQYPRRWDEDLYRCKGDYRADKTICAAEVMGVQGRAFTVVAYTGPEAREAFEKDFRTYSRTLIASSFQVYGVNTNVPLVLFHNELRPVASFVDSLGYWGKLYLQSWRDRMRCLYAGTMWMDTSKGVLCVGPQGPEHEIMSAQIRLEDIPSNIELLQDDMCLRFLASFKSKELDRKVLKVASISLEPYAPEEKYGTVNGRSVNHTSIIFGPTNTTVAVGAGIWRVPPPTVIGPHLPTDSGSGLGDRSVMANGESRFTFIERKRFSLEYNLLHLDTDASEDRLVWLSQASCVFHTRGIFSEDEKLRDYTIASPYLILRAYLSDSGEARQRRNQQPLYLFLRPAGFPKTPAEYCQTASYHYWSFEPTGQPSLSKEACHQLGLPFYFSLYVYSNKISHLENISYKRIHEYQVARGFDPKTSDFARFLGYPAYEVQHDSDRFEEVDRAVTIVPSTSPGSTRRTIAGSKSTKSTTPPSEQSTPGPSHSTTTAKPRFSVAARQTYQAPTNLRASSSQLANRNSGNDKTTENKGKMRAVSSTPRRKTSDTSSSMPDGKKGKKEITTREAASPVSRGLLKTSTLSSRSLNPPTSSTIGVPAATLRAKDPIPAARNPSQRRVGVPAPPGRTREEEKTTNRLKGASQSVRAPVAPRLPLRSKPATTVPSKLPKPPMMEGASASTSNTPPTKPCAASTSSGSVYDEPPKAPQAIGIGSSASTRKVEGEGGKEAQTPISSEADATTESFQSRAEALEKLNGYIARKNVLEDEIRRLREKLQRLKSMNGTLGPGSSTIA